ncbi:hypothetical protein INT48_005299 [Thamnidium elegans]|uniref:Uncharacterized protein n=1 Tax=Thamnidium elegans TaxID=101142 RepID=A0A8H7SSZ5_9FUNG|nr:hypothetical protein INT48_005299 [Thamnidium elegans]
MAWDFISTWIKYEEKFYILPNGKIINKPFSTWTEQHQHIAQAIDYVECVNLSMQVSVFFLLQCFWNYLSNAVAKKSFMSSWEFKFYIFWALGSSAIFPILQWYFRHDPSLRETAPQLAYSIEMLFTSVLGLRSNARFKRLLKMSRNLKNGSIVIEKLEYFKDMNIYLTVVLFSYGISLATLCIDGLTVAKVVNQSKFASDFLIANCNAAAILMWLVSISIFHPRRSTEEIDTSSKDSNGMRRTKTSHGTDLEISDKFNNGSFSDAKIVVNGQRLSQRMTNFIENKNAGRYDQENTRAGNFLRPMGPVEVDYASQTTRSFTPTHQFTLSPEKSSFSKSIAVEDPYTNTPINFTMVDPKSPTTRFQNNQPKRDSFDSRPTSPQEYPMQTMSVGISNQDDFRFDPLLEESSFDYLGTARTPTGGRI